MKLPQNIAERVQPLLDALPLDAAMGQLVVKHGASNALRAIVKEIVASPEVADHPPLCAGLWLYVDELDLSHEISQTIQGATGSFWHGIMHRREGDFSNSHYWMNRVGRHPAMVAVPGYEPHSFIDDVEAANGKTPLPLVDLQRREWAALFSWCAKR